jgi:hypothetical protein
MIHLTIIISLLDILLMIIGTLSMIRSEIFSVKLKSVGGMLALFSVIVLGIGIYALFVKLSAPVPQMLYPDAISLLFASGAFFGAYKYTALVFRRTKRRKREQE